MQQTLNITANGVLHPRVDHETLRHEFHTPGEGVPELARQERKLRSFTRLRNLLLVLPEAGEEADVDLVDAVEDDEWIAHRLLWPVPPLVQFVDENVVGQEHQVLHQSRNLDELISIAAAHCFVYVEEIGL